MLTPEIRKNIWTAISKFKNDPAGAEELEILGWLEISHVVNYTEGAYELNKLLEEKRNV